MEAEGVGGELRCGYALAARLGGWRLAAAALGEQSVVRAELHNIDPYWITQRPLTLSLRLGDLSWSWDDVQVEGGELRLAGAPREGVKVLHGT